MNLNFLKTQLAKILVGLYVVSLLFTCFTFFAVINHFLPVVSLFFIGYGFIPTLIFVALQAFIYFSNRDSNGQEPS